MTSSFSLMEAIMEDEIMDLIYSEGHEAYRRYPRDFNPYSRRYERQAWDNGWADAELEMKEAPPKD